MKVFLASVLIISSFKNDFPLSAKYSIAHAHFSTSDLDSFIPFPFQVLQF